MIFRDRREAGRLLAGKLLEFKNKPNTIALGLARGGVVVAAEVAKILHLPLNVVVPRKIGAPGNPELAVGAIMEDGEYYLDETLIGITEASEDFINKQMEKEKKEAQRRIQAYRGKKELDIEGKNVILIDDGIATGATMLASIRGMRAKNAAFILAAAPVASTQAYDLISQEADKIVCVHVDPHLGAIGYFYQNFGQTTDQEVVELLK